VACVNFAPVKTFVILHLILDTNVK